MSNRIDQQWGNYRLSRLLGRGGFAEVYLGEHVRLGMAAAIKILHAHLAQEDAQTFLQEARTIASLQHPHIIRVHDFDMKDDIPFLVLDYAPQGSLKQCHARGECVSLPQVVDYVKQISSALQYAHDMKLIHRDIKPQNMLLGTRGEVLLSDFGIVTMAHSTSSISAQASVGTVTYMAPEQIQGYPRPASDQYALAITVYQWLTGEPPFQGPTAEVIARHISVAPPPLRAKMPELPAAVEQVVLKALAKDPKERFESIQAFAQAFEQASQPEAQALKTEQAVSTVTLQSSTTETTIADKQAQEIPLQPSPQTPPGYMPPTPYPQNPQQMAYYPYQQQIMGYSRASRPGGGVALKYGLIAGAILSGISILVTIISFIPAVSEALYQMFPPTITSYFSLVSVIWSLIIALLNSPVYFCTGLLVTRRTGQVGTAMLACLWALFCFLIVDVCLLVVISFIYPVSLDVIGQLLIGNAISFLIDLVLALILGFGLGILGALVGQPRQG